MRIELIYEGRVIEEEKPATPVKPVDCVVAQRELHKKYECDVLDRDMIESPKGKKLDRFIINDLQLTVKRDVDQVIEMLENVKEALQR